MQKDLRTFISELKTANKLLEFQKEVDPKFEFSLVRKAAENSGKGLLFKKIKGSQFPIITNLFGSRELLAILFKTTPEKVVEEYATRMQKPIEPNVEPSGPVKEVVKKGSEVNLEEFPIVTHSPKDTGPYITSTVVVAKDPDTGIRNVSVNRLQLKGKNRLGFRMLPTNDLALIQKKLEEQGKEMEVAVAIGNHPFEFLAAAAKVPIGFDEFMLSGALRQEPLRLVKCETVDLEIPATAEIVLEGKVPPGIREPEAPFGDFQQAYFPQVQSHILEVQAISHRKEPIFQTIQASSPEDVHVLALSREAIIYEAVSKVADVQAISLVPMIFGCAISIRKKFDGEPKNVAAAAFGCYSWLKYCVIVDHDVDVFNISDVWWAMTARSRPDTNTFIIPNALGFSRDPCNIHQSKIAIDATVPSNRWQNFERIAFPGYEAIKLEDYL